MDGFGMPAASASIRKSASFRSRIPVRRSKVPHQRRCHSPPVNALTNSASVSAIRFPLKLKKKTKGSQKSVQKAKNLNRDRRYSTTSSSSSYSSSDESAESQDVHYNNNKV